jgi:hypothetical protein
MKWFVHRRLCPEEFGGLVHITKTNQASYPLHPDVLNSHAVAGACATIGKAWFNDLAPLTSIRGFTIMQPSEDGLSLVPYEGSDANQLTIGGEMNKLAPNIAIGRNHAAVHWRHDYADSLPLGEAVAISMLNDMSHNWIENFEGFSFTRFNGQRITGVGADSR